nr:TolC family protein [Saprospiraceae bacterium]
MKSFLFFLIILITAATLSGQSLDSLVQLALENNKQLESFQYRLTAAELNTGRESAWDPPQLQAGYGLLPVETRVGPQVLRLGAQQQLPWPGHLRAKTKVASSDQQILGAEEELTEIEIAYRVKNLYYGLFNLTRKNELLDNFDQIYKEIREDRLRRMESDRASYSEVLLAERSIEEIRSKKEQLFHQREAMQHALAYWLGLENIESLNFEDNFREEVPNFIHPVEPEIHYPTVTRIDLTRQKISHQKEVNQWAKRPQITLGLDYIINTKRTDVEFPDNGKNAFMPRVGISLPFFSKKYRHTDQILEAELQTLERYKEDELIKIRSEIESAQSRWHEAHTRLQSIRKQIEITEEILEIVEWEIGSEQASFYDYWKIKGDLLGYELQLLEIREAMQTQKFIIEKFR